MAVQAHLYPENLGLPLPMPGLQDWILSFDADICFNLQGHPQQTLPFHLDQKAQNLASSSTCDDFLSTSLSQSLDAQLEVQRQELDCILQLQARFFLL
ncbi:hypothetical protein V6N11_014250 [Hibiscus sabdariffa]|uniref:Uncharacterized protein n=1 Tax=Hibiscus sabdariffa TaxID=183260 RepID=A0ABR1ZRC3_9ROSI